MPTVLMRALRCGSKIALPLGAARRMHQVVDNSGSTARDHLANERTFLAWSRTGLGFLAAGLGYFYASTEDAARLAARPEALAQTVMPATALLVSNGLLFLGFASARYFQTAACLRAGKFPVNTSGIVGVVVSTGLATSAALYLIVHDRVQRSDDELVQAIQAAWSRGAIRLPSDSGCGPTAATGQQVDDNKSNN